MKLHKTYLACLCFIVLLAACTRGNDAFLYPNNMVPYTVKGFNGSNEVLDVKLDTTIVYSLQPRQTFSVGNGYAFNTASDSVTLTVTEHSTGKKVLERRLKKSFEETVISFMYMDGIVSDMPDKPEAQEGKFRATWMFKPTVTNYKEPVDIVIGKFYFTPKVFEEIARIKNVKPNEFSETITLNTPLFTTPALYNGQNTSVLLRTYIYKAGTNEFYTQGLGYTWDNSSTVPAPAASVASSKLYVFSESPSGTIVRFTKLLEL